MRGWNLFLPRAVWGHLSASLVLEVVQGLVTTKDEIIRVVTEAAESRVLGLKAVRKQMSQDLEQLNIHDFETT